MRRALVSGGLFPSLLLSKPPAKTGFRGFSGFSYLGARDFLPLEKRIEKYRQEKQTVAGKE
jgi:hypothetical protein